MPLPRELASRIVIRMPLARRGVAGVPMLGRYHYTAAQPGLGEHAHDAAIEICYLVTGRQTYRLGGRDYRLSGGDVFIAFPGERHSTGGHPEEKGVLYWLVLRVPRAGEEFLGLPAAQGRAVLRALLALERRHFRGAWKMKEHMDAITALYHEPPSPFSAFAMANRVGAFVGELIACARSVPGRARAQALQPILRHIEGHLDEPLSVPDLAGRAGLSVARFKTRFKQETGIPPGEYVMRVRIEEAQRRLARGGATITDIAFDLGFSSSQYFATVFKRFTGRTPSARGAGICRHPNSYVVLNSPPGARVAGRSGSAGPSRRVHVKGSQAKAV